MELKLQLSKTVFTEIKLSHEAEQLRLRDHTWLYFGTGGGVGAV